MAGDLSAGTAKERKDNKDMKTGVIDVGGGMRGIYASGVLDFCVENHIIFDVCIGVSAGSANLASYIAGQKGRNYPFYADYSFRSEYMGARNFLRTGNYLNLSYVYETLSNEGGENPLDYNALSASPSELYVLAEEAEMGREKYFTKKDMKQDDYRVLIASCNIPVINRPYDLDGTLYFDGGLAEPIPIQKAFDLGCDRVVLILSKPADVLRKPRADLLLSRGIARKYPAAADNLKNRANRYNNAIAKAKELEKEGRVLIVAPKSTDGIDTLSKNREAFEKLYRRGVRDGEAIKKWFS